MPEAPYLRGGGAFGGSTRDVGEQGATWWRESGAAMLTVKGPSISKKGDAPDFSVGLGEKVRAKYFSH